MPGTTQYLDTPVVPTSAFAGAGYNNVDCAYPDATPAIAEVDGDGIGPWVSAAGQDPHHHGSGRPDGAELRLLRAVGHHGSVQPEDHHPPLWLWRDPGNRNVTIGGSIATGHRWSDTSITVTVPTLAVPNLRGTAAGAVRRLDRAVRPAGHHRRQRQTVDRRRHGDDRRQGSDPRHRLGFDPECD